MNSGIFGFVLPVVMAGRGYAIALLKAQMSGGSCCIGHRVLLGNWVYICGGAQHQADIPHWV